MYIDEEKRELKEQLDGLYTGTNSNQDNKFNKYALIFASISFLMVILTYIYDTISISQNFNSLTSDIFTTKNILLIVCKCSFTLIMIVIAIIIGTYICNWIIQKYDR